MVEKRWSAQGRPQEGGCGMALARGTPPDFPPSSDNASGAQVAKSAAGVPPPRLNQGWGAGLAQWKLARLLLPCDLLALLPPAPGSWPCCCGLVLATLQEHLRLQSWERLPQEGPVEGQVIFCP